MSELRTELMSKPRAELRSEPRSEQTSELSISQTLARFVAAAQPEALGQREAALAKEAISDCIGCIVAGSVTDVGSIVRGVAESTSPNGPSTAIGGDHCIGAQA